MKWIESSSEISCCCDASEFIGHLTSFTSQYATREAHHVRFIYRGDSDASHQLIPSALRRDTEHPAMYRSLWEISDSRGRPTPVSAREFEISQRRAELNVARHFYQYAERAGLSLPHIANENIRRELLTGHTGILDMATNGFQSTSSGPQETAVWPPTEILPILGLAQHYGLPTRLLDWSHSPLISAYFAASGGLKRLINGDDPESLICVWATFANTIESYSELDSMKEHGRLVVETLPARLVQPAASDNPNLSLQRGVFTVVMNSGKIEKDTATDRRDLKSSLLDFEKNSTTMLANQKQPLFFKLHLPIRQTPELMHGLSALGYSANRIYDGYSGAAEAVRERAAIYSFLK